ncbi:MAG: sulfur carrier protein ThiS [Phycisphaeraceae bacterium]|nr:sulfur carrier protein ThiS [Phycisphaeraceae bacterium]
MKVTVNGREREVPEGQPVSELVKELGLGGQACAVEVNRQVVPKRRHEEHRLSEGDRVEIVTLIGGG